MSKSREAGFLGCRRTDRAFTDLVDRLRSERLIQIRGQIVDGAVDHFQVDLKLGFRLKPVS